jgi:hypothetical protein
MEFAMSRNASSKRTRNRIVAELGDVAMKRIATANSKDR